MKDLQKYFRFTATDGRPAEWGINRFPDGQVQFWIEDPDGYWSFGHQASLKCSIVDTECLDIFRQIIHTVSLAHVNILYLYGARCDKTRSGTRTVAHMPSIVLSDIILRGPTLPSYSLLAPHCDLWIDGQKQNAWGQRVTMAFPLPSQVDLSAYDAVVFPDGSSTRRFFRSNRSPAFPNCHATGKKVRDQVSGRIDALELEWFVRPTKKRMVLVIDDLCDGGATFLKVADMLTDFEERHLAVTHGIFSNNAVEKLSEKYEVIYSTNSYDPDLTLDCGFVQDVWE